MGKIRKNIMSDTVFQINYDPGKDTGRGPLGQDHPNWGTPNSIKIKDVCITRTLVLTLSPSGLSFSL